MLGSTAFDIEACFEFSMSAESSPAPISSSIAAGSTLLPLTDKLCSKGAVAGVVVTHCIMIADPLAEVRDVSILCIRVLQKYLLRLKWHSLSTYMSTSL